MVAVDFYVNETTRHADVILPPTTSARARPLRPGLPRARGAQHRALHRRRCSPSRDDARHDWEIFRDLALRDHRRLDRQAAAAPTRLRQRCGCARARSFAIGMLLRRGAVRRSPTLRRTPQGVDLGPLRPTLPGRLQTPDKRIDLRPRAAARRPRPGPRATWPRRRDGGCVLIGRRHQRNNNSWMHNVDRLTKGRPRHHLLMHPDDLAARGLADGDRVPVRSRVGAGRGRGGRQRRHDARRGEAPPRLRPPAPGTRMSGGRRTSRASRSTTSPTPSGSTLSGNAALNGVPVTVDGASRKFVTAVDSTSTRSSEARPDPHRGVKR